MIRINEIQKVMKDFHTEEYTFIQKYAHDLAEKKEIISIQLSGSLARHDYMPGEFGGAIDLTLLVNDKPSFNPEKILGSKCDDIPEHFIKFNNRYLQFTIIDTQMLLNWTNIPEAQKYAIEESISLIDKNNKFMTLMSENINKRVKEKKEFLKSSFFSANKFIDRYTVDRWKKREAYLQLHLNLNKSIEYSIKCLFYLNNKYTPAANRMQYFCIHLQSIPENLETLLFEMYKLIEYNESDYLRRETLYKEKLLKYIETNLTFNQV